MATTAAFQNDGGRAVCKSLCDGVLVGRRVPIGLMFDFAHVSSNFNLFFVLPYDLLAYITLRDIFENNENQNKMGHHQHGAHLK